MWRKFTVYGLRFSKTSFWNRINTGFLDPAVATVLTACGIETGWSSSIPSSGVTLQQCLPLAVLKPSIKTRLLFSSYYVATVLTACGIETNLPLEITSIKITLQQCLPLAVLKLQTSCGTLCPAEEIVATVLTACGIETHVLLY